MRLANRFAASLFLVAAMACSPDFATAPEGSPAPDLVPAPAETPAVTAYFPPPDASGGWRRLVAINATPTAQVKADIRSTSGLDWDVLKQAWDGSSQYGGSFVVIRRGWIAAEFGTTSSMPAASCTKTLSSLAIHRMFELSAAGALTKSIGPEDLAHQYLPASWGSDPGRRIIQVRHLLNMSSGLVPDDNPPAPGGGTSAYQQKLLAPGIRKPPGQEWIYSSLPVDVMSLVTTNVTGIKLGDFFQQRIGSAIGITTLRWATLGSHTYASAYATVTARDLARIMYLLLQRGAWNGTSLVSGERIDAMTQWDVSLADAVYGPQVQFPTDPNSHLRYGRLTWTNHTQSPLVGAGVPADAYYCAGFKTNFATVIPSLDLVIVRLQNGPTPWGDAVFRNINSKVVSAVVAEGGGNAAPTVQITSPSEGAGFAAGDTITIAAASADADGSVVRVEFFANGTPVGVATAAPYTVTWPDVAAGNYALTARSTDDLGANTTSVGVSVTVAAAAPGNSAPSALITSPAPGASFAEGTSIAITADAADTDGSVTRVEFFAGTTPLGTVTAAPYTVVWSDAPAGVHVLTARSTDDLGATTTSAAVSVTVASPPNAPPSAQITSPANGASFVGGASVTITAAATDPDGSVTQVQFFAGSMLVGTATSAPYTVTWNNVPVGSHALTARSRDDAGATTTSGVVSISVAAGTGNLAPTVRITSPTANATFRAGGSITLAATASDADGRVAKVTFYAGTNHLYTDTAAPYGYTWRNVPAGSYRIMARATDNLGKKTSTALTIAVTN